MSRPELRPEGEHLVAFDTAAGVVIIIDPSELRGCATGDALIRLAKGACWDEVLREAAARLAGESDCWSGGSDSTYGDQRDRLAFLADVKAEADRSLTREAELLRARLASVTAEADRCWRALGGGGDNVDAHSRACSIRYPNHYGGAR